MFELANQAQIYLYPESIDMRWSFDRLSYLCRSEIGLDPDSGLLFIFFNRNRKRIKLLYHDGSGSWIFYKRYDQGRFEPPKTRRGKAKALIDKKILTQLLTTRKGG